MNFKCNHCERVIDHRLFGDPEIKCYCGARYTKTVIVEVKEETFANSDGKWRN